MRARFSAQAALAIAAGAWFVAAWTGAVGAQTSTIDPRPRVSTGPGYGGPATAAAQEARIIAQAMGHKPEAEYSYSAPPVFLFEPHQPEMCNFKPQVILNIDEVWDIKRKTFEILAAQKHLWAYYERVALQRGMQGGRNTGANMTYGEAYQRLFPMTLEVLA